MIMPLRRKRHGLGLAAIILLLAGFLTACGGDASPNAEASPHAEASPTAPTAPEQSAMMPTIDPDAPFLTPVEPITADNAPQLQQLGILQTVEGRASSIFNHALSLDGTRLVALNNDLMLVWNLATGRLIYQTSRANTIRVYFAPDQDEIYRVNDDGTILIYAADQAVPISDLIGQNQFNQKIAYAPQNGLLALGGSDGSVRIWDVAERTAVVTLQAHDGEVLALAFDDREERLATTGTDQLAKIWDWRNRTALHTFDHIDVNAEQVALSPDGTQMVAATVRYVAVWDTSSDDLLYSLQIERGGANDILDYSHDGTMIASGGGVSDLLLWRAEDGTVLATLPEVSGNRLSGVFGADNRLLLTTVLDRAVSLWDVSRADEETVPRATLDIGTRRIVRGDWTEDGFLMLFFDVNGIVYVWGIADA